MARQCLAMNLLLGTWLLAGCLHVGSSLVCPESRTRCSVGCLDKENVIPGTPRELCRCDPQCALYDDCCEDYWTNCVNESSSESRNRPILHSEYSEYLGCVSPIDIDPMNKRFVVVDRCPPDWAQGAIKSRCESTILSRQEKLLTLFVNGPGDIVFKNVYCTICHGIEEYDIRSWTVELWNCEPAEGETQPVLNGGKPDYTTCSNFHMEPPSMLYDPHRCYSSFVNRCTLSSTTTAEQMQLCENHTSLLFNQDVDVVYKNVHCWNCSRSTDVSNIQDLRCTQVLRDNRFNAAVSFTLIFDFTGRTVHSVERKGLFNGITSSPQLLRNCSQWQIYDPFQDVCQDLTCPNGQPPQSSSGACLDARQRKALGGSSNLSEDCIENLIAMNSSEMSTSTDLWTSADIADEGSDSPRHILNIYTSFASADRIQKSLDPILSNVTDTNSFASLSCNASLMILVASGESETNKKGICEGFSFGNISFSDLLVLDGVFSVNIGGFVYDQHEFMHETEYFFDINEASVIRRQSVTLCNPFVGSRRCSLLTLYPDDFFQSTDGGALIHAETGVPFLVGEYWLLPDGTVRVCQIVWYHVLGYVSYVGTCCSVLGLILALVTYGVFPSLRNTPGKIVMNLMGALLMAQLFLMFTDPKSWFCVLRALMLHFCWLSVFFWMNVLSCDLAYNLKCNVRPARPSRRGGSEGWKVLKLSAFAWGLPAVIVVSCFLASQFRPEWFGYGGSSCWIVGWITSAAFGLSISVAIIVNLAMFVYMVCIVIANHRRLVVARLAQKTKTTILLCFKLAIVTGVTWIFFFVANLVREPAVWYISVLFNSLQGALIALTFLLKASVRKLWREKLKRVRTGCWGFIGRHLGSGKSANDVPLRAVDAVHGGGSTKPCDQNASSSCDTLSTIPSD
ncbi:uncharacterized protein LOC119733403 isoform X2 [Patiria miniata]|uniref:G-protein coupled receptors family 2 profile 2 domain-containing protein n=1 Tax=Patiria miniata TaxID=46514 RepID=A0A914AHQ4_PATMI|nr:uncharacterized protein LOC119733403 isoform X2 [Patiria miniata]